MKVLQALENIHAAGVVHRDMEDRHIVHNNGDVRIIDFDLAIVGHICKHRSIIPYRLAPLEMQFGCHELYELLVGCEIFTPSESVLPSVNIRMFISTPKYTTRS